MINIWLKPQHPRRDEKRGIGNSSSGKLLPVIGWTEAAFELLQDVAKRLPMLHE